MIKDCWGSLSRIFLGAGLGMQAISCLSATVFFGLMANKYGKSAVEKLSLKSPYGYISTIHFHSIIIAVCGGISTFLSVLTIIISIPFSKKILLLIILGGCASLFGLGCTVVEGIFTRQAIKYCSWNLYDETNNEYYDYPFGYQTFSENKDAQEYIKNSIKDLYSHGYKLLEEHARRNPFYTTLYTDFIINKDVLNWSQIEPYIGQVLDNKLITYSNFWVEDFNDYDDKYKYIYFTLNYDGIYAHYSRQYYADIRIAALSFTYSEKFSRKLKFCWYKEGGISLDCKIFETGQALFTSTCDINSIFSLNEYIVNGPYYSKMSAKEKGINVNYEIRQFPIAYRLLNYTESQDVSLSSFEDSTNHYRVSGKECAMAYSNDMKNYIPNQFSDFYLSPEELNSVSDLIRVCIDPVEDVCIYTQFGKAAIEIQSRYENSNKGQYAPFIQKYYDKQSRDILFEIWDDPFTLFVLACINMVVQCLGIIIWGLGRILGFLYDVGDDDNKSDEAKENSIMNNQLFGSLA